jgi:hypothetical protein
MRAFAPHLQTDAFPFVILGRSAAETREPSSGDVEACWVLGSAERPEDDTLKWIACSMTKRLKAP